MKKTKSIVTLASTHRIGGTVASADKLTFKCSTPVEDLLQHPPREQIFELRQIYLLRVNPVVKVIHCSSFSDTLLTASIQPQKMQVDLQMLMFSIYLASICTLDNDEVLKHFQVSKASLTGQYMSQFQAFLDQYDIFERPSIPILQALVLQATCLQSDIGYENGSILPIVSKAIFCARALGVENTTDSIDSPLDIETLRRCWWTLVQVALQGSLHPSSSLGETLLDSKIPLPLNINDVDLNSTLEKMPKSRDQLTDMSYFLLSLEITRLDVRIQKTKKSLLQNSDQFGILQTQENLVEKARLVAQNFLGLCDASRPFDWFMLLTARAILNPTEITLLQQYRKCGRSPNLLPALHPDEMWDDREFSLSLDVVECWHILKTNPKLKSWSWQVKAFRERFSVEDIQAKLVLYPRSTQRTRAYALLELISQSKQ